MRLFYTWPNISSWSHHKQSFSFSHLFYYLQKNHTSPAAPDRFNVSTQQLETEPLSDQFPQYIQTYGIENTAGSRQRNALYDLFFFFPKVAFLEYFPYALETFIYYSYKLSGWENRSLPNTHLCCFLTRTEEPTVRENKTKRQQSNTGDM